MEQIQDSIQAFIEDPIVCTELMSHCGSGYRKFLYVETNVITKEVIFTVKDRIKNITATFADLESAITRYEKIFPEM